MALETEAKLRVDDHDVVRGRLDALGATFIEKVLEHNTILDSADGSLRARGCGLRIRSVLSPAGAVLRTTMTFKGPVRPGAFKSREELELEASDAETLRELLGRLGFVTILRYEKRRESWSYGGCRVELDEAPHIGRFVEIEGESDAAISNVQQQLSLGDAPHVAASYVRMMLEHCHRAGLAEPVVAFS